MFVFVSQFSRTQCVCVFCVCLCLDVTSTWVGTQSHSEAFTQSHKLGIKAWRETKNIILTREVENQVCSPRVTKPCVNARQRRAEYIAAPLKFFYFFYGTLHLLRDYILFTCSISNLAAHYPVIIFLLKSVVVPLGRISLFSLKLHFFYVHWAFSLLKQNKTQATLWAVSQKKKKRSQTVWHTQKTKNMLKCTQYCSSLELCVKFTKVLLAYDSATSQQNQAANLDQGKATKADREVVSVRWIPKGYQVRVHFSMISSLWPVLLSVNDLSTLHMHFIPYEPPQ